MSGDVLMEGSFYPNCCHVCKLHKPNVHLKRCSKCRMISYCSVEHQKKHWSKHKDLCKSIVRICQNSGISGMFEKALPNITLRKWCTLRSKYMAAAEVDVARKLCKYEREMFFFPRVCRVCKTFNGGDLIDCDYCLSASYCSVNHKSKDATNHSAICSDLRLCLEIDTKVRNDLNFSTLMVSVQEEYIPLPQNTIDFILSYIMSDTMSSPSPVVLACVSELFSCPLTLLYALEMEKIMSASLIVHVVGASCLECSFFFSWESVLHWLPHVKHVSIVFIGPDVIEGESVTLCSECEKKGKGISIKLYKGLYHDFVTSDAYETPSIVLAYNSGIAEQKRSRDTWSQSIPYFLKYNAVPFVFTSYTTSEAESDLERVQLNAGCEIIISVACERNRFSSYRPYRDWETDPLSTFCSNSYLSIVKCESKSEECSERQ